MLFIQCRWWKTCYMHDYSNSNRDLDLSYYLWNSSNYWLKHTSKCVAMQLLFKINLKYTQILRKVLFIVLQHLKINSNKSISFCYPFPVEWGGHYAKSIVLARFLIYYAVPLLIIGIFYIMIARHLMFSARVPGEIQGAMRQVSYNIDLNIYNLF